MKHTLPLVTVLLLTALATTKSFALDVASFGARSNDGHDDTEAFLAAFKEAQAKGDKRIVIPKGRYLGHGGGFLFLAVWSENSPLPPGMSRAPRWLESVALNCPLSCSFPLQRPLWYS